MTKVTIQQTTQADVKGAHIIAAFPSVGLVATIAARFLVERLDLKQIGVMDCAKFPTLSVVENGEPLSPVRMYAGTYDRKGKQQPIVVFMSEFQPRPDLVRPVSEAIIDWAKAQDAAAIVAPEGLIVEGEAAVDNVVDVYSAGSTDAMRQALIKAGAPLFKEGIVAGVTGVLLNLGTRDDFNVVAVLSEAQPDHPDARSAATVVDLLAQLVEAKLDTSELYEEADAFDKHVHEATRRRQMQEGDTGTTHSVMYG